MTGKVSVELTQVELSAAISALYEARTQTNSYLRGWPHSVSGHDTCCAVHMARMQVLNDQRLALEAQLRVQDETIIELERHEVRPEAEGG